MKFNLNSFKDKQPKRGKIICFNAYGPAYYLIDYSGNVYGFYSEELGYACQLEDLQEYGSYKYWDRITKELEKALRIDFTIPED